MPTVASVASGGRHREGLDGGVQKVSTLARSLSTMRRAQPAELEVDPAHEMQQDLGRDADLHRLVSWRQQHH